MTIASYYFVIQSKRYMHDIVVSAAKTVLTHTQTVTHWIGGKIEKALNIIYEHRSK